LLRGGLPPVGPVKCNPAPSALSRPTPASGALEHEAPCFPDQVAAETVVRLATSASEAGLLV